MRETTPIRFERNVDDHTQEVWYGVLWGEVYIGEVERDLDDYFVYWPFLTRTGFWEAVPLRAIADKLDELNKEWDEQVTQMLESYP